MLDVKTATTEDLEEFVRHDIETRTDESSTELLFEVLDELRRRDQETGRKLQPTEEAWCIVRRHYTLPKISASENDSTHN